MWTGPKTPEHKTRCLKTSEHKTYACKARGSKKPKRKAAKRNIPERKTPGCTTPGRKTPEHKTPDETHGHAEVRIATELVFSQEEFRRLNGRYPGISNRRSCCS